MRLIPALIATLLLINSYAETANQAAVVAHYGVLVQASYQDALGGARKLQAAVDALLAAPSDASLQQARQAWLEAREWYGQTEAFRFYGGPIDSESGPEPRLNAWPMDEAYVDYVKGKPKAGIINNPKLKLSRELLVGLNEKGGEENISTGWHAIEFILWGQDQSVDAPGARPVSDFIDGKGSNAQRRRAYLKIVSDLLVDDLASVAAQWDERPDSYRSKLQQDPQALAKIMTGLGALSRGELAGERMEVALASKLQEDEHSCFSDNTHRDIVNNARGIQNVWEGRYQKADGSLLQGPSLKALVADKLPDLAEKTSADLTRSVSLATEIKPPFDREIVGKDSAPGRQRVRAVIDALKQQAQDIVDAAKVLGVKRINTKV